MGHGLHSACKPLMEWLKPSTSTSEMASMDIISRPSPCPEACILEQPNKAILHTELPKGSSLMGVKPSSWINLAPDSPVRMNVCAIAKMPAMERKEVSPVKGKSAA